MSETQQKIKKCVEDYMRMFKKEHELVVAQIASRRSAMVDEAYGTIKNTDLRALYEISETLSTMLTMQLSEEELVWFKTKEGGRWFAKTFPMYRSADSD